MYHAVFAMKDTYAMTHHGAILQRMFTPLRFRECPSLRKLCDIKIMTTYFWINHTLFYLRYLKLTLYKLFKTILLVFKTTKYVTVNLKIRRFFHP